MSRFKRATVTYLGPSEALRHHCNPSGTDNMFFRGEPLEVSEADAEHYAKRGGFSVDIEYFPKKAKPKGKPKDEKPEAKAKPKGKK